MASRAAAVLGLIALTAMLMGQATEAVDFAFSNNAQGTTGGNRFDQEIGQSGALEIMDSSTKFIWDTFHQQSAADRKNVDKVTLIVESMDGVAYTSGDQIHLSADYVGNYGGDVKAEIRGVLYHEMTHVWQWDGKGNAPSGLIEGIADYVRLTAGLAPSHWVKPGSGDKWDQGYDVTAYFLQYCESISSGFVANMNTKLASGWDVGFFNDITGKSVDQLWSDYKAKYASSG
ncbi:hypothetical protein SUGI_0472610 [Cryptomeria japonica]|uniref:uncharacterized protein LOC131072741 n=1 Tax=Cryptomeria japonica TaxID=3369 RepID=UPI002408C08A|nr:uncharacterized protein LOC131072741 [Cryptomeria japonica]XP_059077283.1 uncharacterized protein LOC131876319 [Cryptomeria japonica]GLJ24694.1 hypothetical protein SUGI_0472280 [Cryptomeria japonica]GLJ24715.1 hypothetical protein SUGI_0472610 [Cryptomeria japonica]